MADVGSAFSSGVQGGLTGFTVGGPLGAAIGGGLGLLSGIFSDSPEELAKKRWETFKKQLTEMKANTIRTGSTRIGELTSAAKSDAAIRGRRQAIASGRDTQAESFMLPGIGKAGTTGANALTGFLQDTNDQFNKAEMQADMQEATLPLPEQPSAYFDTIAGAVGQYASNKKKYDMLEKALGGSGGGNYSGISGSSYDAINNTLPWLK
jgi:hypothetical protein